MNLAQRVTTKDVEPEVSRPHPAKVTRGDPLHTTWNHEEPGGIHAGVWHSTPGAWMVIYSEWEYFHILGGYSVLTAEDGTRHELRAGDALILRPGFRGVWDVIESTLKEYVIRV